jgi:hypothetical protein
MVPFQPEYGKVGKHLPDYTVRKPEDDTPQLNSE